MANIFLAVVRLLNRLPPRLRNWMPGRYEIKPALWMSLKRSRALGSMICLTLLLIAMIYREDTHTLTYLKKAIVSYYLALVPPNHQSLSTDELWDVITNITTTAVITQNITHNGTFKGVISLRQFRLLKNPDRSFFPRCDYTALDQSPLDAPPDSSAPYAYKYGHVMQMGPVDGHWCPYPPEGYVVYLGDLLQAGVPPTEILKECLEILGELRRHSWVDKLSMAVLLTLLTVQPGTATPTGITIIFENPREIEDDGTIHFPKWWSSYSEMVTDLRPSLTVDVLLPVFLVLHLVITWVGTDVSIGLIRKDPLKAIKRCLNLATAVYVIILALHITVLYFHFTCRFEAQKELARYRLSFDMSLSPSKYEYVHKDDDNQTGPHVEDDYVVWDPEYKIQIRRIRLIHIVQARDLCWRLLSTEVMLYLASFILAKQYFNYTVRSTIRTIRVGILRAMILVCPILGIAILSCYCIHRIHHTELEGYHYHTFASVLRDTVHNLLGTDKDPDEDKTDMEWIMGFTFFLVGCVITLFFWGIHEYVSADERRAMAKQRLPLHPL